MRRELAIEFSRVTEAAALAGYKWLGRGDKNLVDGAAVEAVRLGAKVVRVHDVRATVDALTVTRALSPHSFIYC